MQSTLYRLIYISQVARRLEPATLEQLLGAARRHNTDNGITGLLLFDARHFMQVLEGPREAVNETYLRIVQDQRHRKAIIVSAGPAEARCFAPWDMAFAGADKDHRQLFERFMGVPQFEPERLSPASALALMVDLSPHLVA